MVTVKIMDEIVARTLQSESIYTPYVLGCRGNLSD